MDEPTMLEYNVSEATNPHTCPIPGEQIIWKGRISNDVHMGKGYPSSVQLTGMIKQPGSP